MGGSRLPLYRVSAMSTSATFALAVIALSVVVVGVAYVQITWRTSGASLRMERRLASFRRRTLFRQRGDDGVRHLAEVDVDHSDADEPPALIDAAV